MPTLSGVRDPPASADRTTSQAPHQPRQAAISMDSSEDAEPVSRVRTADPRSGWIVPRELRGFGRKGVALELQQPSDMCSNERCSLHVLVVDDNDLIRTAIAEAVQEMGVAVTEARDGLEALEALATGPRPCLALVDLMMPRMCGEEFARAVRKMNLDLAIVSMSAGSGALAPPLVEGHIWKPFSLEQLEDVVERHCAAARRMAPRPRAGDVEAERTSPETAG